MENMTKTSDAEKVVELYGHLVHEGISDYELLDYFFQRLTSRESLDILRDFADISGIEVDEDA